MGDIVHETERLYLQSWDLDDFQEFAPIARDPLVMRFIADGQIWPDSRIGWFIGNQHSHQQHLGYCNWKLVKKNTSELIGLCGIAPLNEVSETEIGWWLSPSHWQQGLAFEAASCVKDAAFKNHGLKRLVARVYKENTQSVKLIEKLGMTFARELNQTKVGSVLLFELNKSD